MLMQMENKIGTSSREESEAKKTGRLMLKMLNLEVHLYKLYLFSMRFAQRPNEGKK